MILILVNPVLFSIDRKPAVFDTISVSSDNRPGSLTVEYQEKYLQVL